MITLYDIRKTLDKHRNELMCDYKIKGISIFGSYARGEQTEKSDIDLLADFEMPISLLDLIGAEQYLSEILNTKVDLIPREDVRLELKDIISKEAIPL
ncbi:DNA polymerase beta domain-containing protein [Candidatus Magnetoovum chiemensis]|nr:DNA polymerase beta domain-containing protein [Candidatus Magnetoovum chiemensis]